MVGGVYIPPSEPTEVVGRAVIKSVDDLQKYQSWEGSFRSGEIGITVYKFSIPLVDDLPDWMAIPWWSGGSYNPIELSKEGIARHIQSRLENQGVYLPSPPKWFGNELFVYHRTGIGLLLIIAMIVGVLFLVGILSVSITLYKLRKAQIDAQQEVVLARQEGALEVISEIEDEGERADLLATFLKETKPKDTGLQFDLGFEKPMMILVVGVVAIGLLYIFLKGGA